MKRLAQMRLLQLASQALPIGGFSHSQGLEAAVEAGLLRDEASVQRWLGDVLEYAVGSFELPVLWQLAHAWAARDRERVRQLNELLLASREAAELRHATVQMGYSMRALLAVLPEFPAATLATLQELAEPSLPVVWSAAADAWEIDAADSAAAYLWSWAENQVLAALKTAPIGQAAGQRILLEIGQSIASLVGRLGHSEPVAAQPAPPSERPAPPSKQPAPLSSLLLSNFAPGLAILASRHETQYSRLFRS
jgi:urease accessory protein